MHDLWHTAASHLIMSGVDIRTLADILGHRTLQMVQHYTHLLHDHKLTAIDKIGSLDRGRSKPTRSQELIKNVPTTRGKPSNAIL